jgi:hypothetical protein
MKRVPNKTRIKTAVTIRFKTLPPFISFFLFNANDYWLNTTPFPFDLKIKNPLRITLFISKIALAMKKSRQHFLTNRCRQ